MTTEAPTHNGSPPKRPSEYGDLTTKDIVQPKRPSEYADPYDIAAASLNEGMVRTGDTKHQPVTADMLREMDSTPVDVAPMSIANPIQASRLLMVQLDPLLRKLPYEQRTALLLNLLVTYASEQPAALQHRGKFINAMVEEFRKRLQTYLPLNIRE